MTAHDHPVTAKPLVLVVDDATDKLRLVHEALDDAYIVIAAHDGEQCLAIARSGQPPDLILLDVVMPGLGGHEVCRRLKADEATRDIPVVFLTARADVQDEELGLQLGAVDFIANAISPTLLRARVQVQLRVKQAADFLRDRNGFLRDEVARRTAELAAIQDVTTLVMASLAETRDAETSNHIRRTQYYVKALARRLSGHPRFAAVLTPATIELLFRSAALHDIGKAGIPDRILLKPGKLSPEEFEIMKTHTTLGHDAIANAKRALGVDVDYLRYAKEIAYSHHEKWDGTGYPLGLAGDAIPISGRLMALADVYDAIISRRLHKEAMSHEQAAHIIQQTRGRHFDPDVVDAFLAAEDNFKAIAIAYADSPADLRKKVDYLGIAQV
ncbi:MAG: two-component system response regulator [Polaromonas sp.]|nr:two-component system response regulator [Polaromonas sp.]